MEGCEYCNQPEFCLWFGSVSNPCSCTCSRFNEDDNGENAEVKQIKGYKAVK